MGPAGRNRGFDRVPVGPSPQYCGLDPAGAGEQPGVGSGWLR